MAYSSIFDLQDAVGGADRLVQLADWDGDRVADPAVVDSAIASADAEIDSYSNKQFRVPYSPVPETIKRVSARRAKFRLASARGMTDQFMKDEYDADTTWLEGVRDGLNSIGAEPVPDHASMRRDAQSERSTLKDVSRFKLRGFS